MAKRRQQASATDRLVAVPLFSALSKAELRQVERASDEIDAPAGRVLVTQGRTGREFFLILSGEAVVHRNRRKVATLGPGQYFGELSLIDRGARSATVTAVTDMHLLVLGQREFAGLLEELPAMAAKLLKGLAQRLRDADARAVGN